MSEWREIELGDVVEFQNGFAFKSKDFIDLGTPVIKIKNVKPNKIILDSLSYVSDRVAQGKESYLIKPNDILITMSGNRADGSPDSWVGKSAMFKLKGKFLLNQRVSIIRVKNGVNDKFIAYCLSSWDSQLFFIHNANSSGGQANIAPDLVKSMQLTLPPLKEQKAIAYILSSLDDKIDLLHSQNQTLEAMAETLFRQWFVEEASEEWAWREVGEFVEVLRGLSYKGSGLSDRASGVPMHNLNSVYEGGGYKREGIKYYSGAYKEHHMVRPGEVIVTNTEQGHDMLLIGYPAIIPDFFGEEGIFSQHIYKLVPKNDHLSNLFVYYLVKTHDVREQITGATNGSTVNMLPKDGIEWAKFKLPSKERIDEFTEVALRLRYRIENNHKQIKTLESFRNTLLPKLINGEVRVQVSE